jgi:hypothetical protein
MLSWPMAEATRKVTVNVPELVLERARKITGRGVTETIVEALRELERQQRRATLRGLKGRIHFSLDLEKTRR